MDEARLDRLRAHAETRLVAVPDTEGDVQAALARLEQLVGAVAAGEGDQAGRQGRGQLAVEPAREALERLSAAVRAAEAIPPAQPIAPAGLAELVPLAWAAVERADLIALGLAVQAVGRAWGLGDDEMVADAVVTVAGAHRMEPADLVAEAARLQGLLSLPWDGEVARLARLLPTGVGRVVLDEVTHRSYGLVADRILAIWYAADPAASLLYRGR